MSSEGHSGRGGRAGDFDGQHLFTKSRSFPKPDSVLSVQSQTSQAVCQDCHRLEENKVGYLVVELSFTR